MDRLLKLRNTGLKRTNRCYEKNLRKWLREGSVLTRTKPITEELFNIALKMN